MRVARFSSAQSWEGPRKVSTRTKSLVSLVTALTVFASTVVSSSSDAHNPSGSFRKEALESHNIERKVFGSAPLQWSAKLEAEALTWAEVLANEGQMRHASNDERKGAGENLWMGPTGVFSVPVIVGTFIDEKRNFVPGLFPKISSTGQWRDVGHYSQVVWPETQELGCAVARNDKDEFWVCRYWPSGNRYGVELNPLQQSEIAS